MHGHRWPLQLACMHMMAAVRSWTMVHWHWHVSRLLPGRSDPLKLDAVRTRVHWLQASWLRPQLQGRSSFTVLLPWDPLEI